MKFVKLPNGLTMTEEQAKRSGHTSAVMTPERAWRTAILTAPEALERSSAAVEIVTTKTPETMSVEAARAFLRGLPVEQPEARPAKVTTVDPRAVRLAQIETNMAAFNRNRGHAAKPVAPPALNSVDPIKLKRLAQIRLNALDIQGGQAAATERTKLRYALQVHDTTGMPLVSVFKQLAIDTSKMFGQAQ